MAEKIGVRELKYHTSKIVRAVREELAEYIITVHGEPVAVLRPVTAEDTRALQLDKVNNALAKLNEVAGQIEDAWQAEETGTELLEQMRDERDDR